MSQLSTLLAKIDVFAKHDATKYTIWWRNPDKQDQWDVYQSGLSKARAERLALDLTLVLSPRWFGRNVSTQVLRDGDVVKTAALEYKRVWGPYNRNNSPGDKRQIIRVQHMDDCECCDGSLIETISYPKFLVEQRLGRKLAPNETVDHRSYDISDNSDANLEVLDRAFHSAQDTRRVKLVDCTCAECGKHFQRSPRKLREKSKAGKTGPFCSRSCAARHARHVQYGNKDKAPCQEAVESEYYRRKIEERAKKMAAKWGSNLISIGTEINPTVLDSP